MVPTKLSKRQMTNKKMSDDVCAFFYKSSTFPGNVDGISIVYHQNTGKYEKVFFQPNKEIVPTDDVINSHRM